MEELNRVSSWVNLTLVTVKTDAELMSLIESNWNGEKNPRAFYFFLNPFSSLNLYTVEQILSLVASIWTLFMSPLMFLFAPLNCILIPFSSLSLTALHA